MKTQLFYSPRENKSTSSDFKLFSMGNFNTSDKQRFIFCDMIPVSF